MPKRKLVLWLVLAAVLGVANYAILHNERVLANGESILLELAPRDPRALMQGDYMALRYRIAEQIDQQLGERFSATGAAVVSLDANNVATFVRLDDATTPLGARERRLVYRKRGDSTRIAGDAYFFQEGRGEVYASARYGELKVDVDGDAVLVGLRDADRIALSAD